MSKLPYDDRPDLLKLQSQWNKIGGIVGRKKEWSAAIVRAATAAEIAANIAGRKRFETQSAFSTAFVDSLLGWANGLDGKFRRLLIPSETDPERLKALKALKKAAEKINDKRNDIVHCGFFAEPDEARAMVKLAREVIEGLVKPLEPDFVLRDQQARKTK